MAWKMKVIGFTKSVVNDRLDPKEWKKKIKANNPSATIEVYDDKDLPVMVARDGLKVIGYLAIDSGLCCYVAQTEVQE